MKQRKKLSGMTLIELIIVIGILGVLFSAVYMFFVKGTEQFHFARRQNNLATTGRMALEMISDELLWAGYMPEGGWDEDDWHPIETAENGYLSFYSDRSEPHGSLEDNDYRHIFLTDGIVRVTDNGYLNRPVGTNINSIQFNYLDGSGNLLSKPLNADDRDAVRHVVIKLTLQDSYMGDVYQTVMQTMITPRNLGVVHNFNPEFYPPGPPDAKIVVNIDGDSLTPAPNVSQQNLVSTLDHWGYTLVQLTDDQLASYDYEDAGVDLVILRDIGTGDHTSIDAAIDSILVPVIALDPEDAVGCFDMGIGTGSHTNAIGHLFKTIPSHPIHSGIIDPDYSDSLHYDFDVYDNSSGSRGRVSWIDSLYTGTLDSIHTVTEVLPPMSQYPGVVVMREFNEELRRVFYPAPEFEKYSSTGYDFLYNVINWILPTESTPPLGEEIVLETFEGDPPENVEMTFWSDSLEGGAFLPDSIILYRDFQLGGTHEMMWSYISTGEGRIIRTPENVMQTDRAFTGAFDQNTLGTVVDLGAYSALSDELYMRLRCWRGTSETIGPEDGIFLVSGGNIQVLAAETFENPLVPGGYISFFHDANGRHRLHSPKPDWGGNTTNFLTMDSDLNGSLSRNRMIFEIDTSTLSDSSTISVNYLMCDHGDSSDPYNPGTGAGDFVGWSLSSDISAPLEGYVNLEPGTQANGNWYGGSYTFVPTGAMPDTIYIVIGQYGDMSSSTATAHDGMSFDDIYVVASDNSGAYTKIGEPSAGGGYVPIHIDLDDAAIGAGIPFSSNFAFAIRQGGMGSTNEYGILWKNFELGYIGSVYNAPGWDHGPVVPREKDDWVLERILGNHMYTLHAHNLHSYSNNVDCWLESPEFGIPSGTYDAVLSYTQKLDMELGWDFGWLEISTDSGETWEVLETAAYNSVYDGHGAFSGFMSEQIMEINLDDYSGYTIKVRFMFHSDATGVRDGWQLDDFRAYGTVAGLLIDQIGFKPEFSGGSWFFDTADVYLGRTTDTFFDASGELDKNNMTYCGSYPISPTASEWVTIDLSTPFILLAGTNLQVKIEMNQAATSPGFAWITAHRPSMTRDEQSPGGDPGLLKVSDERPALMVNTITYGQIFVDGDSTGTSGLVPLSFASSYGDFEGLYLMSELGFTIDIDWIHGGTNDDWEIGAPVFIPDIDPSLKSSNGNAIAGTDLTDDGLYNPDCWAWIQSPPYDISDAAAYDSVDLGYDRCLRMAINDKAWIQMAFTETTDPPESGDWVTVAEYTYQDEDWLQDVIRLTNYFTDAVNDGKNYYLIRFIMDAGPFAEQGGWNIDNVGFYGRNSI